MDLRKRSMNYRNNFKLLNFKQLELAYHNLCAFLDSHYGPEISRTESEEKIYNLIIRSTKLHVYRSMWIGKRNIDLFIPAISCNKGLKGLAIEIDGSIHERQFKIKQDEAKYDLLQELSIGVTSIKNEDCNSPIVKNIIQNLSQLKRIDHRSKMRMFRNIYLKTLTANKYVIIKHDLTFCASTLKCLGELDHSNTKKTLMIGEDEI